MAMLEIPSTFSDIIGFGVAQQVYTVRRRSKWGNAVATVLLLGGSAACLGYGAWNAYSLIQRHGPAVLWESALPFLIGAAILFIIGLFTFWGAFTNWKKSAVLYQEGFAYCDRNGTTTCLWNEIESIKSAITKHYHNGIYTGTTHVYTVEKKDGTRLVINDSLQKVEELANLIREKSFPLIYQRTSSAYNSGQPVSFGPVTISRGDGISIGRKSYPWDQVNSVSIQRGFVSIAKKGGGLFSGANASAANIPNLEVMLSIINQIVEVKSK